MIPLETGPLKKVEERLPEPEVRQKEPEAQLPAVKMTPAVLVPRQRQVPIIMLDDVCKRLEIKRPAVGSEEEAILEQELKNIYTNVGRYYHDLADAHALPLVVKARRKANIPREQKWAEDVRHAGSYIIATPTMFVLGGIGTLFANVADAFSAAISHAPIVMGTGLLVFLASFLIRAWQYSQTTQALSMAVVMSTLGWSLLFGVVAALFAGLLQAFIKYFQTLQEEKRAEQNWRVE